MELIPTRENAKNLLKNSLDETKDNISEEFKFTSEQIAKEIEEEVFAQNNYFCGCEEYREKIRKINNRIKGLNNDFIRKILKKGLISVKKFCNLKDYFFMDDKYFNYIESSKRIEDGMKGIEKSLQSISDLENNSSLSNNNKNQDLNKEKEEEKIEGEIRDHLKCYMCLCKVKKPKMCKFCKKISCEECTNKWLQLHNICMNCKNVVKSDDMINLPFLEDMASYFIYNIDNHPKNIEPEDKINVDDKENDINDENNENKKICKKHGNQLEYYCVQCNEYYCSNCLLFFGDEVKKHKNHVIFQESKMKELGIKEAIQEFVKLPNTKNILEKLIHLCKYKIKENEVKKCQISNYMDLIKKKYIKIIDNISTDLENILKQISAQRDSIEASIASIPNGLNNIINNNDYVQGNIVFKELKKFNRIKDELQNKIKDNFEINPKLLIEHYESEYIDFCLPPEGQYSEGQELLNKKFNFIHKFPSNLIIQYLENKINLSFSIDIDLPLNDPNYPRFYSYMIFDSEKYGQDFTNLNNQDYPQIIKKGNKKNRLSQQINGLDIDFPLVSPFYREKVKMKIIVIKTLYSF